MIAGLSSIPYPKILAQILDDTFRFALAIIRNKIYGEVDVRFAKVSLGLRHYDESLPQFSRCQVRVLSTVAIYL